MDLSMSLPKYFLFESQSDFPIFLWWHFRREEEEEEEEEEEGNLRIWQRWMPSGAGPNGRQVRGNAPRHFRFLADLSIIRSRDTSMQQRCHLV